MLPTLTDLEFNFVVNIAIFVVTLVFSTKIKDFFKGIPSDARADLTSIETNITADVNSYRKALVAKFTPAPAPVVKAAPVPPVPPVAPAA